jgi:hypothetical protein
MISLVMLKSGVFSKITAFFGIAGSVLFIFYFIFTAFMPDMENAAMAVATPGGLLSITWMILFAITLLKLRFKTNKGTVVEK